MSKQFIVIVTRERSGSTVLQRFLASCAGFDSQGELWNVGSKGSSFYTYWKQQIDKDAANLRLNRLKKLFTEFLDEHAAKAERGLILDTKYGNLDSLRYFWGPKFGKGGRAFPPTPTLLEFYMEHHHHIIHLTRRNKLAIYISILRARQSGVWRQNRKSSESTAPAPKLTLGVGALRRFIHQETNTDRLVAGYLAKYDRCLSVTYEQLLPGNMEALSAENVGLIASFLGIDASAFNPALPHSKIVKGSLLDHIENADEVCGLMRELDAEWMLG